MSIKTVIHKKQAQLDQKTTTINCTESNDSGDMLNIRDTPMEDAWILAFGCSIHICPHEEWIMSITWLDHGLVLLGNNQVRKVLDIGNIRLNCMMNMSKFYQM